MPRAFSEAYRTPSDPLTVFKAQQGYEKQQAASRKDTLEAQKAQLEQSMKGLEFGGQVAQGVEDMIAAGRDPQEAWQAGIATMRQAGFPVQGITPTYDATMLAKWKGQATALKDRLTAQQKVVDQQLAERRLALEGRTESRLERAEGRAETKAQREEREAAGGLYPYVTDSARNEALNQAMQEANLPRGSEPPAEVLQRARMIEQASKEAVAGATGREAAQARTTSETAQKRLEALDKNGLAAQDTQTTLDEVERLLGEGVYGNSPVDRAAMVAYRNGLRANDTKAQRTARLQELGNQLILARGSLGSNVSNTDAQIYARAAGNFQQAKNLQEMQESIRSMRTILNKAVDYANTARRSYEETGRLPALEGRPDRGPHAGTPLDQLTPAQRTERKEWLKNQLK
jgi:hypothetical protein